MAGTITRETYRKAKERPKDAHLARTKEGKGLVLLMVRRYFTHSLSNVIYMQIRRFNNNRRFRISISK
jgi:hypothetical protein